MCINNTLEVHNISNDARSTYRKRPRFPEKIKSLSGRIKCLLTDSGSNNRKWASKRAVVSSDPA